MSDGIPGKLILPNTFVLGAAKCGTTALVDYLYQNKKVYKGRTKECHFFNDAHAYHAGLRAYSKKYFSGANNHAVRLDATPAYLRLPDLVGSRLQIAYGMEVKNLKFIVMVRDPVSRAYSHYRHMCRSGLEDKDFEQAIKLEEERLEKTFRGSVWWGYLSDSYYAYQLNKWLCYINRSQLLILDQKNLKEQPQSSLNTVCDFLKIDRFPVEPITSNSAAVARYASLGKIVNSRSAATILGKRILGPFLARRLRRAFNSWNQSPIKADRDSPSIPEISVRQRKRLYALFEKDLEKMRNKFGIEIKLDCDS